MKTCYQHNIPKVFQDNIPGLPSFILSKCCKEERPSDKCQLGTGATTTIICVADGPFLTYSDVTMRKGDCFRLLLTTHCHGAMLGHTGIPCALVGRSMMSKHLRCTTDMSSACSAHVDGQSAVLPCASGLGNYFLLGTKMFGRTLY